MMKNDTVVLQQPSDSLVKPSMSRTLVYQTNKEFDKCAELLRNILTVQESRRTSKSSIIGETNRKNQQQQQFQVNLRPKKTSAKSTITKSSFIKTNLNTPTKSLLSSTGGATIEDQSLIKTRLSPNKSRKHQTPTKTSPSNTKFRQKSPSSPTNHRRRRRTADQHEFIRSSSCGDLPSNNFMQKKQTKFLVEQFVSHLTKIRTISKQIRNKTSNTQNDPEYYRLWNELETSLSSALAYANNDIQYQLSLEPLRNEIVQLRKQLQTTNVHLRQYDNRRIDEPSLLNRFDLQMQKNQYQYSHLLIQNQELKVKCDVLQEKLNNFERTNIRLIQRWTQQDIRSLAERQGWISTDNRFLLREEILLLKQKLYHVYDDLATLFNRNHSLEIQNNEQKQQILFYKQQFNDLKQSAQHLLNDLDKRAIEDKVKRFLNDIILEQQTINNIQQNHITPTKITSSSFIFETPHKTNPNIQPTTIRTRPSPILPNTKLRPKSLFITPTVLNDATALSKLQQHQSPTYDSTLHTPSSSSTIYDAESISTSSLYQQENKRTILYNSLPTLNLSQTIDSTNEQCFENANNNESGPELDQISDLTSKMFSSGEEEDVGLGVSDTSTSSSTIPTDAERLMQM